jgi:FkbM family methyltransferase
MKLDYIEIGTSDFETILQSSDGHGISIDPLLIYLENLPKKENNIKLNVAISDKIGRSVVFYVHPDDILKYNLPNWVRGCNSIMSPHPSVIKTLQEFNLSHLYRMEEIEVINWDKLIRDYNIVSVDLLKIDTEGHDTTIINDILKSKTNILPKKIIFETNSLSSLEKVKSTIQSLQNRGYEVVNITEEDTTVILKKEYPSKIIFSSNKSSYLDFWKHNSEICSKILNITPILFLIDEDESDFYWDDYGIIKKVKQINNNTALQSQVVRLYSSSFFREELIMISDIDMFLFDKKFILNSLKSHKFYDLTIIGSDAYDLSREECKEYCGNTERYPMCYIVSEGKVVSNIMGIENGDTFESFYIKNGFNYGWDSDEIVFSRNLINSNFKINRISRNYQSNFYLKDRIEKTMFGQNKLHQLNLNILKSLNGFIDCHCPNFELNKDKILLIKHLILSKLF